MNDNENNFGGGLFGEASRNRFARVYKPEEITARVIKKDKPAADDENSNLAEKEGRVLTEKQIAKKEKKKDRKRKIVEEGVTDDKTKSVDTTTEPVIDATLSENEMKSACTAFLGNLSLSENVKSITKLCKEFGEVQSVRLRSVPYTGAKVDDAGNQNLVRKVCVNSHKLGDQKGSFNAYVVFKSPASVVAMLSANNRLVGERHLRVDKSTPTLFEPQRTCFLGALPHYIDDEELRGHFAKILPRGQDDIEGVRIIRDPDTLVGKGIGYLLLKDRDAVSKALTLNEKIYKKRWPLRVTLCGKRTKRSERAKNPPKLDSNEGDTQEDSSGKKRSRSSSDADTPSKKRVRKPSNGDNAAKRIKLKSVQTRTKALKEKGQKKAQPGRKGKRLGGVVKRAMKAAGVSGGSSKKK